MNVAIGQGAHDAPHGLSLSVSDRSGRFRVVRQNLGFPAGKDKTVLVDLSNVFLPGAPRRSVLSTNLEIYWDRIGWAVGQPGVSTAAPTLALSSAVLRARGFSVTSQRSPKLARASEIRAFRTTPRLARSRRLHTRFGDVRELLTRVDDRYVIMNAGDELALQFPAAPPPAPGLVRDFIVVSDGWVKDGDYNTTFSRTVLPLPTHATGRYATPPGRLEDDPSVRAHQQDFATYHTRYVTAAAAREALRAIRSAAISAFKKPVLALIFVALLATPVVLRHYRRQMPEAPPAPIRADQHQIELGEFLAHLGDRGEVDRGVLADRGVRAAAGLDTGNALGRKRAGTTRNSASHLV